MRCRCRLNAVLLSRNRMCRQAQNPEIPSRGSGEPKKNKMNIKGEKSHV